jgi:hypothetical protein
MKKNKEEWMFCLFCLLGKKKHTKQRKISRRSRRLPISLSRQTQDPFRFSYVNIVDKMTTFAPFCLVVLRV